MSQEIPEEQLWSWVDRDAEELAGYLAEHPEAAAQVEDMRRTMRAVGEPRLPESIGGHRIVRKLGAGGMGVVYEAEQERPRRSVALKVIRGAWVDDEKRRRLFEREADTLGRLTHPGIAAVFEAGETESGEPYIVMELASGKPLTRWSVEDAMSVDERLTVFADLARAVHHAHENGVIHRDLKPANILVSEAGQVKVLDFGLARIVDTDLSMTAAEPGKLLGTLRYMSPEQARGLSGEVTRASDVYSLGVLLFELLTRHLPHSFEGTSFLEAARIVSEQEPLRPRDSDKTIPRDLETIVLRALEREPDRRYGTALELAEDLERFRAGEPIVARPATVTYRSRRWIARHPAIALASLVALVLVLASTPFWRDPPAPAAGPGWGGALNEVTGRDYPKLAPWGAFRWKGEVPVVRIGGEWYELLQVGHLSAKFLVEHAKQTAASKWRERIEEDLVEVIAAFVTEKQLASGLEILVRDPESGAEQTLSPRWTSDNRNEVREYRRDYLDRSPFDGVTWDGDTPHVRVGTEWFELLAIEGVTVERLREIGAARYGDSWKRAIAHDTVEILEFEGRPPEGTVTLALKELDTAAIIVREGVALTAAKRSRIRAAVSRAPSGASRRSPYADLAWNDDQPLPIIDGTQYRLVAIHGIQSKLMVAYARTLYPERWRKRFGEDLDALLGEMGHVLGSQVDLEVEDMVTGETLTLPDVSMTHEKRQLLREARSKRGDPDR